MEYLLTNLTASLTELRDTKALKKACGNQPVAIFNRNQLEGYFVPASSVSITDNEPAADGDAMNAFNSRKDKLKATLDYLKDK